MKLKTLAFIAVLSLIAFSNAHAFGFGAQANLRAGEVFAPGFSLLFSPGDNTHLAVNWYIDSGSTNTVGLTFDIVPLHLKIVPIGNEGGFHFTLGGGVYGNSTFTKDKTIITGGVRVPVGFNVEFGRNLEIFTHVAPSFGVDFNPSLKFSQPFYPIAVGARLWAR